MTERLTCPECGSTMSLRSSRYGLFYGCDEFPKCRASHGAHPDGRPLGIPANAETKQWRMKAHEASDGLWKSGRMGRNEAYVWLAEQIGLSRDDCHIGRFDIEQCKRIVETCEHVEERPGTWSWALTPYLRIPY